MSRHIRGPQMLKNQNFLTRSGGGTQTMKPVYTGSLKPANTVLQKPVNAEVIQQVRRSDRSTWADDIDDDDAFLNITRETNNILTTIPFCLWTPVNLRENYFSIFQETRTVPILAGVAGTIAVSFDNNGDCLQAWTLGGNTDIIRIHSTGETSYATMLSMIETSGKFTSSGIRYFVDDAIANTQFRSYNIFRGFSSYGGVTKSSSLPVLKSKSPGQFQNGIIDRRMNLSIANNVFMVHGFRNSGVPATGTEISWAFFNTNFWTDAQF